MAYFRLETDEADETLVLGITRERDMSWKISSGTTALIQDCLLVIHRSCVMG